MQIANNQVSPYSYNTSTVSNSSSNTQTPTTIFASSFDDTPSLSNAKLLKSDILSFIEKHDGFSSLSKENEKLFREILADDKISTQEAKSLTYEEAKAFKEFQHKSMNLDISTYVPIFQYEDNMATNIIFSSSITNDDAFNKSFFETLKNINTNKENNDFYNEISDSLGYNNNYMVVPEPREEYFEQLTQMQKEIYKDYENPEAFIIDYTQWEIKDYATFIQEILSDYKQRSQNPIYELEQSVRYKNVFLNLLSLEKNYNNIEKQAV